MTDDWRLPTVLLVLLVAVPRPATAALTGGPAPWARRLRSDSQRKLRRGGNAAPADLPAGARSSLQALRTIATWWRIALRHPADQSLDATINARAGEAIRANTEWTTREANRGEAWFYLAGSYAPLVQWHALRGQRLAAARNGKRIKDALEKALQLDPELDDAYFGIGLYHYYADVAPMGAKFLRWLLLLPGGDRAQGLREMLRARDHGQLMTGEADFQLQQVYLWYEHNPAEALRLLQKLDARYPSNPLFLQRIAEVQATT